MFEVADVAMEKFNIERGFVGAGGVDPVSLSQSNPNPMREGKPQDPLLLQTIKLHWALQCIAMHCNGNTCCPVAY